MQDIHSIGGGGGRLFGGGDRRIRPNQHHNLPALKCPRCDSLNTKFCYYNNYNLSQPRHFCKSCRRYWTKGGVLRNVPVGGGCRKSKRSKPKSSASTSTPADGSQDCKSNSHSSSESSSLTATTTAAAGSNTATASATAEVASTSMTNHLASNLVNYQDSSFFIPPNSSPSFDQPLIDHSSNDQIFQDIGTFSNMISSSNDQSLMGFANMADIPTSFQLHQSQPGQVVADHHNADAQWPQPEKLDGQNMKMQEITAAGFLDHDFSSLHQHQSRGSDGGLAPLDWQHGGNDGGGGGGGDHELFDLPAAVDQAYWSQNYLP